MTYVCENCGFLFYRAGEVKECPSCNVIVVRPATKEEIKRLQKLLLQGKSK